MDEIQARSALDTGYNPVQVKEVKTLTGEELIISKLISIENRITKMETSMSWFVFVARGGIITIAGFLGINLVGLV